MQRHRLGSVVEAHFRFDAERSVKGVRATRAAAAHMIGGKTGEAIPAQPVRARIPDMQQVGDAAAQHQRREGAAKTGEVWVLPAHRMDPGVERTDDPGPRLLHLHGLGQIAKAVKEPAHRGFGGDAAALCATDPVGDRRHHLLARLRQLRAVERPGEILVVLARPGLRGEADACLNPDFDRRVGPHDLLRSHQMDAFDRVS